jgi:hypothetical protein
MATTRDVDFTRHGFSFEDSWIINRAAERHYLYRATADDRFVFATLAINLDGEVTEDGLLAAAAEHLA